MTIMYCGSWTAGCIPDQADGWGRGGLPGDVWAQEDVVRSEVVRRRLWFGGRLPVRGKAASKLGRLNAVQRFIVVRPNLLCTRTAPINFVDY